MESKEFIDSPAPENECAECYVYIHVWRTKSVISIRVSNPSKGTVTELCPCHFQDRVLCCFLSLTITENFLGIAVSPGE